MKNPHLSPSSLILTTFILLFITQQPNSSSFLAIVAADEHNESTPHTTNNNDECQTIQNQYTQLRTQYELLQTQSRTEVSNLRHSLDETSTSLLETQSKLKHMEEERLMEMKRADLAQFDLEKQREETRKEMQRLDEEQKKMVRNHEMELQDLKTKMEEETKEMVKNHELELKDAQTKCQSDIRELELTHQTSLQQKKEECHSDIQKRLEVQQRTHLLKHEEERRLWKLESERLLANEEEEEIRAQEVLEEMEESYKKKKREMEGALYDVKLELYREKLVSRELRNALEGNNVGVAGWLRLVWNSVEVAGCELKTLLEEKCGSEWLRLKTQVGHFYKQEVKDRLDAWMDKTSTFMEQKTTMMMTFINPHLKQARVLYQQYVAPQWIYLFNDVLKLPILWNDVHHIVSMQIMPIFRGCHQTAVWVVDDMMTSSLLFIDLMHDRDDNEAAALLLGQTQNVTMTSIMEVSSLSSLVARMLRLVQVHSSDVVNGMLVLIFWSVFGVSWIWSLMLICLVSVPFWCWRCFWSVLFRRKSRKRRKEVSNDKKDAKVGK